MKKLIASVIPFFLILSLEATFFKVTEHKGETYKNFTREILKESNGTKYYKVNGLKKIHQLTINDYLKKGFVTKRTSKQERFKESAEIRMVKFEEKIRVLQSQIDLLNKDLSELKHEVLKSGK